jgi:lipopolysaccharide transport system ATP-binding protein
MPGMSLEATLRDQHNLPIGFYSSSAFNQVLLPTEPGRYECILSLDAYQLAAGEYGFDLQTTQTNIVIDHNVESAVRFTVDACSPDGVAYNFRQDLGSGHLAMRLTGPLEFAPARSSDVSGSPKLARHSG